MSWIELNCKGGLVRGRGGGKKRRGDRGGKEVDGVFCFLFL